MKGTVYGGIGFLPHHPDADLHGLVRVCVRCRKVDAVKILEDAGINTFGLWNRAIFQESKSAAELHATEKRFGEVLVCPIVKQYLSPENYKPLRESKRKAGSISAPHAGIPAPGWRA
jgi:hypothetical protein